MVKKELRKLTREASALRAKSPRNVSKVDAIERRIDRLRMKLAAVVGVPAMNRIATIDAFARAVVCEEKQSNVPQEAA